MPTYEYKCERCAHRFEVKQSFTDRSKRRCPACKQPALRKVMHPAGIIFKGSGFYKTDSRSSDAKSAEKTDSVKVDSSKTDSSARESGKPDSNKSDTPRSDTPKTPSKPPAKSAATSSSD